VVSGHAPQNGWPCKLVRSIGFPYRTVTVPYIRSENGETAYKHITDGYARYLAPRNK
jgi:hypothetical protein